MKRYSPDTTRNLTIIYGFFFVLLGALLQVSIQATSLSQYQRLLLYILAWFLGLSSAGIGLGLVRMLGIMDDSAFIGFFVLSQLVPLAYLMLLAELLLHDMGGILNIGVYAFIIIALIAAVLDHRARKRAHETYRAAIMPHTS